MKQRIYIPVLIIVFVFILVLVFIFLIPEDHKQESPGTASSVTSSPTIHTEIPTDAFINDREQMVKTQIQARGIEDPAVLEAMRSVKRHQFVLEKYLNQAYEDHPLPIDYGQTISQPYIVALMTAILELKPGDRVLEIGTGSGYQAAVLAEMDVDVYTLEIIPELAAQATERLENLGYSNIQVSNSDGYFGWEAFAPYDAIIVTAAPDHLPQPLINQLAEGGKLVIPIGPIGAVQTLWLAQALWRYQTLTLTEALL